MGRDIRDSLKAAHYAGMGVTLSPGQVEAISKHLDITKKHVADGNAAYDAAIEAYERAGRRLSASLWLYCLSLAHLIAVPALILWWGV